MLDVGLDVPELFHVVGSGKNLTALHNLHPKCAVFTIPYENCECSIDCYNREKKNQ